jgi:DNA-binding response OmpR family regulator
MKKTTQKRTGKLVYRQAKVPSKAEGAGPGTILIVDSDPAVRGLVSSSLRHLGHHVTEVDTPAKALELAGNEQTFDLLVVDVDLRSAGGIALARKLLDKRVVSAILFMTESLPLARALTGSLGTGMFISKPFTAEEFKHRIDEGLRRAKRDKDIGQSGNVWAKQRLRGIGCGPNRGLWRDAEHQFGLGTGSPADQRSIN